MTTFLSWLRPRGATPLSRGGGQARPAKPGCGSIHRIVACLLGAVGLAGCTITPEGTTQERARLEAAGRSYEPPIEQRTLPDFQETPTWRDVLRRSFLANGGLEAAYFRWKGAMERAAAAGAYPNTDVSLGYSYMFSGGRMRALDRSTFSIGFDASNNLVLPVKVERAARVALDEARVAGDEFRVAMFDLQRSALGAWADYKKQAAMIEYRSQDEALARLRAELSRASAASGGSQAEILTSQLALQQAQSAVLDALAEQRAALASLNSMMAREPDAPLAVPTHEAIPALPEDDMGALAAAAETFPEVVRFMDEVRGRKDALELARLRWVPDISPSLVVTGGISQALGAMVTLPTTVTEIRASIRAAEAGVREAEAVLRQKRADRVGEYVALVISARNARRKQDLLERTILPAAEQLAAMQSRAYAAGSAPLADALDARRMQIEAGEAAAEARAVHEKALVEIACCLGVGLDAVGAPVTVERPELSVHHDSSDMSSTATSPPEIRR